MTSTPPGTTGATGSASSGSVPPTGDGIEQGHEVTAEGEIRPVVRNRVAHRRRRRRRTVLAQTAFTVVAVVLLVGLVWLGWRSAMRITGGRDELVTDPEAPGYVAEVLPTTVTLVAVTGDADELISMLLVVSDSGASGVAAVPLSPHTTLWNFEDAPPESAAAVFADGGIDVLRLRLGADLAFGATRAIVVPGADLVQMASATGPLTIQLSDDLFEGDPGMEPEEATLRYPAGDTEIQPEEVDDFLAFTGYREADPNRALRSATLWSELLERLGSAPADTAFGEEEDAQVFAGLVGELVEQDVSFQVLPMTPVPLDVSPPVTIYRVDSEAMPEWVADHVPFPVAAYPGQLATAALLDGTGVDGAVRSVAPRIVAAGVQIALSGNADSFEVDTSRVEYTAEEARTAAEDIASELGVSAVAVDDGLGDVDVTVVVGKDLLP